MGRSSRRLALAGAAAVLAISSLGSASALAGISSLSATCDYNEGTGALSGTITVASDGQYAWAWRTGKRALGGGAGQLSTGVNNSVSATTRRGLTAVKFGVISTADPSVYVYVDCN